MPAPSPTTASHPLAAELDWTVDIIRARLDMHLNTENAPTSLPLDQAPEHPADSAYGELIANQQLDPEARIVFQLALAPHIRPQLLDIFLSLKQSQHNVFSEAGGVQGKQHAGFLPTAETALFVLAGNNLDERFRLQNLFQADSPLIAGRLLSLEGAQDHEPRWSGILRPTAELIARISSSRTYRPSFGAGFPARRVESTQDWDRLVLPATSMRQIRELLSWIEVSHVVMEDWGMKDRLAPGYKALFHGPPGTGKTFTAKLIGQATKRDVYHIDLSAIVSKYIGETEKNLERIFRQAEDQDWILFFDEADALFGKRTQVRDSHDRFANQEVSYLLQRVEAYNGLVLLASNNKDNIDDAFTRRFQAMIHFPMPAAAERLRLWQQSFPKALSLDPAIDLGRIAQQFELAGGPIMNVVRYCALKTAARGETQVRLSDLENGIRMEYGKGGKLV